MFFGERVPYTNFHDMNLDEIIRVIKKLENIYEAQPEEIAKAVNEWLQDHPEATTTVQDGAITYPKLAVSLGQVVYNPDAEVGTDWEKLQTTINKAIAADCATVILPRLYDITGYSLMINKGLYQAGTRLRRKLTFIGVNGGGIVKKDRGYIFTGEPVTGNFSAGDVQFINVYFKGSDQVIAADRNMYCSVFDCHRIIRLTTIGCSYCMVGTVFDGTETTGGTNNMQQVLNVGDICTYSHAYYKLGFTWVVTSYGCTVEQSDYGYLQVKGTITDVHIKDCCLEGLTHEAVCIQDPENTPFGGTTNFIVDGCYFEGNGIEETIPRDLLFSTRYLYNVQIKNCHFAPTRDSYRCIEILMRNNSHTVDGNDTTTSATNAYLLYLDLSQAPTSTEYKLYYHSNYVTSINLSNRPDIFQPIQYTLLQNFNGLVANNLPSDLNQFTSVRQANIAILDSDNALNTPPGLPAGTLLTLTPSNGNTNQIMFGPSTNPVVWYRSRYAGIGWSQWRPLMGAYSTVISNLQHGDTINLPFELPCNCTITFNPVFVSSAKAALIFPASYLSAGSTTATFRAIDPTTKSPSAETGLQAIMTITPRF